MKIINHDLLLLQIQIYCFKGNLHYRCRTTLGQYMSCLRFLLNIHVKKNTSLVNFSLNFMQNERYIGLITNFIELSP